MEIRFSRQELELIGNYLNKISAGASQQPVQRSDQSSPEWTTVFLLLRKLLAYGIHYDGQAEPTESYKELQAKSQKPDHMLATVQAHISQFERLLATYTDRHLL
ncbi:hypothetical protein [Spirosoma koreense]